MAKAETTRNPAGATVTSRADTKAVAELVRTLSGLLTETGLTEIEYGRDGWHVRVARTVTAVASVPVAAAATGAPAAAPAAAAAVDEQHPGLVTSPMVGVVYTTPEEGADPFVKVGDRVNAGQTLVLIEAMKVFNPIVAPKPGVVTRILVTGGTPVEYGEPLLIVE
jgi:acetyl-CoA carboxylase biotin carboxyl carrier protein